MQQILLNEYTDFLCKKKSVNSKNLGAGKVQAPLEVTTSEEFDLKDKENLIIQPVNTGSVTYKNPKKQSVSVIDYEKYINSLPDSVQNGLKRCDFLVYSEDSDVFILNELSQSKNVFDKESHAIHQLADTLALLLECNETKSKILNYGEKYCIFSNRYKKIESPDGVADAFGAVYDLIGTLEIAKPEDIPAISALGFVYYRSSTIELSDTLSFYI